MYREVTKEGLKSYLKNLRKYKKEVYDMDINDLHVYISPGNKKMGGIASVSTLPVIDCGGLCKDCKLGCYDLQHDTIMPQVARSRWINHRLYEEDPWRFFKEIEAFSGIHRAFRWHVGGEVKDYGYFFNIAKIAKNNPLTQYLIFTKNIDAVNLYIDQHRTLPLNLHVMISAWKTKIENRYNLPIFVPTFGDKCAYTPTSKCKNNCTECYFTKTGCWNASEGEIITVKAH